jgi:hypothetical protein
VAGRDVEAVVADMPLVGRRTWRYDGGNTVVPIH